MTSKNTQCSTRSGLRIHKIPHKIRVLKQSQSALFGSISRMTILSVFTNMIEYVKSIDSSVCHKLWSISKSIVQAYSLTIEYQVVQFLPNISISYRFHFFFFEVVVIDAGSRYFVELLRRLVCQLTISLHTFLGMPFHIVGPRRNTKILREW